MDNFILVTDHRLFLFNLSRYFALFFWTRRIAIFIKYFNFISSLKPNFCNKLNLNNLDQILVDLQGKCFLKA